MRWIRSAWVIALGLLAASALPAATPAPLGRAPAPDFRTRTLDGRDVSLAELLADGPVVLDFWATWCQPCTRSLPELQALHDRWADRGLQVLAISVDGPRNQSRVRPAAARLGLKVPLVLDADGALQRGFQVRAIPTTVLIGRDGVIRDVHSGWLPGETGRLEQAIAELLPADTPAE